MSILDTLKRLEDKNDLSNNLSFKKIEEYIIENEKQKENVVKSEQEINDIFNKQVEVSFEDKLTLTMELIQSIAREVSDGEMDIMRGYVSLKKIEKTLKKSVTLINPLATDFVEENPGEPLPYGAKATITTPLKIDYTTNPIYSEYKNKLKKTEDLLKTVVNNSIKGLSTNDSQGNVIEVPDYKYNKTLTIKWI